MHYYKFNIGDYASHTSHLEPLEDLAFRRMLDWVYLHESPLPDSAEQVARLIRMRTHCECIANVLREFFILTDHGWMQEKANTEIQAYNDKSKKAKASAMARWSKKPIIVDANALRTKCDGNANHKPLTTNHKTLNINQETQPKKLAKTSPAEFISDTQWTEIKKIKKAATKITMTERAEKMLINNLVKIHEAGYSMEQVLNVWSEYPHWKTISLEYINNKLNNSQLTKGAGYENNERALNGRTAITFTDTDF